MTDELTYAYEAMDRVGRRTVVASIDNTEVGRFTWKASSGHFLHIDVDPAHQHKGIGLSIWEYANSDIIPEAERPVRPLEDEHRTGPGGALYWAARKAREAREAREAAAE